MKTKTYAIKVQDPQENYEYAYVCENYDSHFLLHEGSYETEDIKVFKRKKDAHSFATEHYELNGLEAVHFKIESIDNNHQ